MDLSDLQSYCKNTTLVNLMNYSFFLHRKKFDLKVFIYSRSNKKGNISTHLLLVL